MRDSNGRFVGGESGNQKGAPRKRKPRVKPVFNFMLSTRIPIKINGVTRQLTLEEAVQWQIFEDALAGKRLAERIVRGWIRKYDEHHSRSQPPHEPIKMEYETTPRNADRALLLLDIVQPHRYGRPMSGGDGPQLELKAWPVDAALQRYRFKPMDARAIDTITRSIVQGYTPNLPGQKS